MIITLDLETIPLQRDDLRADVVAHVKPPATLKKPESIKEWEATQRQAAEDEAVLGTSFDGTYGQIVCIGWAINDEPVLDVHVQDLTPESEAAILRGFMTALRKAYSGTSGSRPTFVGHNVSGFDLPFLLKRCIIHSVAPPMWLPRNPKPWSDVVADTMLMWAGDRGRIGLDRLCRVLGIDGKGDGPTGADVWPMVQAGRMDEVAAYCRADVERTRAVYKRLMFQD